MLDSPRHSAEQIRQVSGFSDGPLRPHMLNAAWIYDATLRTHDLLGNRWSRTGGTFRQGVYRTIDFVGNTNDGLYLSGQPTDPNKVTFWGVFRWDAGGANNWPVLAGLSTTNTSYRFGANVGAGTSISLTKGGLWNGGTGISITSGRWYAYVCSHQESTGELYLLVHDLRSGTVTRFTDTNTQAALAGNGTYGIGDGTNHIASSWNGAIALSGFSPTFLPEILGRRLVQNPWQIFAAPADYSVHNAADLDETVTLPSGTLAITGQTPQVTTTENKFVSLPSGTLAITGQAPQVTTVSSESVTLPSGTLAITGQVPQVTTTENKFVTLPSGVLGITGQAPQATATENKFVALPSGTIQILGKTPQVNDGVGETVSLPSGTLNIAGQAPQSTTTENKWVTLPSGVLNIGGIAPQFQDGGPASETVNLPAGTVTITGNSPTVTTTEYDGLRRTYLRVLGMNN